MKKIIATIVKEWILLRRDVAGMALLLIMPAILIVVMAMIQDAPFRDYQEMQFDLLVADHDRGSLAREVKTGLGQSRNFRVVDSLDGAPVGEVQLQQLLQEGKYRVGIVIPAGATAEVANSANRIANRISERIGLGTMPAREPRDSVYVRIYYDPVAKPTFRMSVSSALEKYITFSGSSLLMQRLSRLSGMEGSDSLLRDAALEQAVRGLEVREEKLFETGVANTLVNSVQHNVPAWAIFGMFFIVIPVAGNMIREREDGSALRVALVPGVIRFVSLGKIFFYVIVCCMQFFLMLGIGMHILPWMGLPQLHLGAYPLAVVPVAIAIAFSATTYGYFIGSWFRTTNQALPFGAISVVILSAMGGIWIPVDILPKPVQHMAMCSPLYWALDGVNQLFLRNLGLASVIKHLLILTGSSLLLWLLAYLRNTRRAASI